MLTPGSITHNSILPSNTQLVHVHSVYAHATRSHPPTPVSYTKAKPFGYAQLRTSPRRPTTPRPTPLNYAQAYTTQLRPGLHRSVTPMVGY